MKAENKAIRNFGKVVRQLREQHGLTQEDLGDLIGKDRAYVSQVERGVKNVTITTMVLLANALNAEIRFAEQSLF